uniref:Uncharacterized protein n=1 Tax=Ciona savignyi TaxID=51511 RepID=H2YK05_CIOSA
MRSGSRSGGLDIQERTSVQSAAERLSKGGTPRQHRVSDAGVIVVRRRFVGFDRRLVIGRHGHGVLSGGCAIGCGRKERAIGGDGSLHVKRGGGVEAVSFHKISTFTTGSLTSFFFLLNFEKFSFIVLVGVGRLNSTQPLV